METVTIQDVRRKTFEDALYNYGVMTLCYLIKEFELKERYEYCQMIIEVIMEHNLEFGKNLPTRYEDCEPYLFKNVKMLEYKSMIKSVPEYAREVARRLK